MMTDCTVRIRNYHLDGYGHVNNARYLEFLEEARWHFFEQHGLLETLGGVQIVVARIDIRYRRSATAGDVLVIRNLVKTAETHLAVVRQIIAFADSGKTAAQADITLVPLTGGRSAGFPPPVLHTLQQLAAP